MKILSFTPLPYGDGSGWWGRDLALTTLGFRALGHDASLVCLRTTHPRDPCGRPVFLITPQEAKSPLWWQSQKPDFVILGLWTRPKYDPIRRAALSATPRVIERADSDGVRTASCGLRVYAQRRYDYFRDRTFGWPALFSIPASIFYSFASILFTPWIEARLGRTLNLLPAVAVETPQAKRLWTTLAAKIGAHPERIHCIPHPIRTEIFYPEASIPKRNQVIAVGRWESYQKNFPLLLKLLSSFLSENPNWSSLVIGSGLPKSSPHPRITFSDPVSAIKLARWMQESKVFLSSSRYESFGLAAAEALCCGCAPFGPAGIESFYFFRSFLSKPFQELSFENLYSKDVSYVSLAPGNLPSPPAEVFFSPSSVASEFLRNANSL